MLAALASLSRVEEDAELGVGLHDSRLAPVVYVCMYACMHACMYVCMYVCISCIALRILNYGSCGTFLIAPLQWQKAAVNAIESSSTALPNNTH